eukprot:TRINITY_DN2179_c0_g1_i1.p1 TRINITY_DN2179_c0_g1~~TRINITY_DN2179_c0_g1_i1.p1  ORF type:complete len:863 (+),score=263.58 TRINITY_DN2179_c0_g1_i1:241-2829(+)
MAPLQGKTNDLLADIGKMGLLDAPDPLRVRARAGTVSSLPVAGGPRDVDEKLWKENCMDLLKVMDICKQTYLILEHSNEAMLRVAVEVVTDRRNRRSLWWKDGWYADEGQREDFRTIIKQKLNKVIATLRGAAVTATDDGKGAEEEALAMLRAQVKELENALASSRQQQQTAEIACREQEAKAKEAWDRVAELEKAVERLREELRRASEEGARPETSGAKSDDGALDELRKAQGLIEEQKKKLSEELEKVKASLADANAIQELANKWFQNNFGNPLTSGTKKGKEMLAEVKESLASAEKQLKEMLKKAQIEGASKAKPVVVQKVEPKKAESKKEEVKQEEAKRPSVVDDKSGLLDEERRRASKLESELAALMARLKELEEMLSEERRAREAAEEGLRRASRMPAAVEAPQPQRSSTPKVKEEVKEPSKGISPELKAELEELRRIKQLYEAQCEKMSKLKEKLRSVTDERDALQETNDKLLRTLQQLKEQLKRIMEIAEKKGLGKQVQEILDESELTTTLNSPEFTCFDRLYEDAMRRMQKQRDIERMRLGLIPRERSQSPGPQVIRAAGGIIGYKGDDVKPAQGGYYMHGAYYSGYGGNYVMDDGGYGGYAGGYDFVSGGGSPYRAYEAGGYAGGGMAMGPPPVGPPCPSCSTQFTLDSKFCRNCGARRPADAGAPAPASAPVSMRPAVMSDVGREGRSPATSPGAASRHTSGGTQMVWTGQGSPNNILPRRNSSRSPPRTAEAPPTSSQSGHGGRSRRPPISLSSSASMGTLQALPEAGELPRVGTAGHDHSAGVGVPRRVVRTGLSHGGGSAGSLYSAARNRGGLSTLEQVVGKGYYPSSPPGGGAGAWTETNSRARQLV